MKLCIVGNSHIGALKRGWVEESGIEATFFGAGGNLLRRLTLENASLVLNDEVGHASFVHTSGGIGRITPAEYDAFLVVGAGLGLVSMTRNLRNFRLFGWGAREGTVLASRALLEALAIERMLSSNAVRTARLLRSVANKPILILAEPRPNSLAVESETEWWWSDETAMSFLVEVYRKSLVQVERRFPVLEPPAESLMNSYFTCPDYTIQPGKIDRVLLPGIAKIRGKGDLYHMNAAYGALVASKAIHQIAGMQACGASKDIGLQPELVAR